MTITRTGLSALVAAVLILGTTVPGSALLKCHLTPCSPRPPVCGGESTLNATYSCLWGASKPGTQGRCCYEEGSVTSDKDYTVSANHKCWIACMHGRPYTRGNRLICTAHCKNVH